MVLYHRLMSKLGHYSIKGDIHNLISGFLMGRSQKMVVFLLKLVLTLGCSKGQF